MFIMNGKVIPEIKCECHDQSKVFLLLKAMKFQSFMTPSPSGSHWAIISFISAGVIYSFSSSAAATKSSSEMKPLLSSSKFWKILSMSYSVSCSHGFCVINFTNSLNVISPPSSVSNTDIATQTNGLPGLQPPYSLIALRRSMGVNIPSQSSSKKSKTCLNISMSRTEHSATIYSLGSKFTFFLALKLDFCAFLSGVWALSQPSLKLPRPRPYWDCLCISDRSQQKLQSASKTLQKSKQKIIPIS